MRLPPVAQSEIASLLGVRLSEQDPMSQLGSNPEVAVGSGQVRLSPSTRHRLRHPASPFRARLGHAGHSITSSARAKSVAGTSIRWTSAALLAAPTALANSTSG